jgi:hypothetical protein
MTSEHFNQRVSTDESKLTLENVLKENKCQVVFNDVDTYFENQVARNGGNTTDVFFSAFVKMQFGKLSWLFDTKEQLWCINQDAIICDFKLHRTQHAETTQGSLSSDTKTETKSS